MSTEIATADLAQRINEAHAAATNSAATAVEHARRAGELLLEARAAVKHGEWQPWLTANVAFSDRTARGYMRLARELPKLSDEKRQRVAEMPLRDASKQLWKMKREEHREEILQALKAPLPSPPGKDQSQHVELWTSARKIVEHAAGRIGALDEVQRRAIRDDFKAFVPLLPGPWAQLPDGLLGKAEAVRSQFLERARERANELIRWVDEQREELSRELREVAATASDYPDIYVGWRCGSGTQADIRFMCVPCWEIPPADDESDDEGTTDFVAEYLDSHPGSTLNDALEAAAAYLESLVAKSREVAA